MSGMRRALLALAYLSSAAGLLAGAPAEAAGSCQLGNGIQHIVQIQFDNVHLRRDNPNVPSDLEQMPNLLNYMHDNGALLTNHHTPLISHTADDIITTLTGTYGDKHGQPVANSWGYFRPDGSVGFNSSFAYWTDTARDGTPQMIDPRGKTHPAPWVPFTRAGCDVGAFSTANIEFENIGTDINNVFGPTSPQAMEASSNPAKAIADFEGIAVHCAVASPICGSAGRPDLLPDEPGGYSGFNALFGNAFVAPQINHGSPAVKDLDGNPVADSHGNPGFPGFDPSASQALGYVATMLEAGVPVVYAYIADAHDNHFTGSGSYGPGEAGYVTQLAAYNKSFGEFFDRLAANGITRANTLFVITSDENDHFAGQAGTPSNCDGVHIACNYLRLPVGCDGDFTPCTTTNLGEVGADLRALLLTEFPSDPPPAFSVHNDDAPTVYIKGNPGRTSDATRFLEHDMAGLQAYDPITAGNVPLMARMGDSVEMALLHMVTKDPARTPSFVYFANPDFYLSAGGASTVACGPPLVNCSHEQPGFNWNHGDFQPDITTTWLGLVGPGVRRMGNTGRLFSDHTDTRPTVLSLAGLKDDYAHDGRVLFEVLETDALPAPLAQGGDTVEDLAEAYKQLNAPLGKLALHSLAISTKAITSGDAAYASLESKLQNITSQRNAVAGQMIAILEAAAFDNQPINLAQARILIEQAEQIQLRTRLLMSGP